MGRGHGRARGAQALGGALAPVAFGQRRGKGPVRPVAPVQEGNAGAPRAMAGRFGDHKRRLEALWTSDVASSEPP